MTYHQIGNSNSKKSVPTLTSRKPASKVMNKKMKIRYIPDLLLSYPFANIATIASSTKYINILFNNLGFVVHSSKLHSKTHILLDYAYYYVFSGYKIP